jgi:hypothetical protein
VYANQGAMIAVSFRNPATGTCYRLVVAGDWRITKARDEDGRLRLAHLRGIHGSGAIDLDAVERLVAGHGGTVARPCEPSAAFAAVVVCDLDRTADVLVAIAREAGEVYKTGCRGFRPKSPLLRQQRDAALGRAASECRQMAEAWRQSGLAAPMGLPDWLAAALADQEGVVPHQHAGSY